MAFGQHNVNSPTKDATDMAWWYHKLLYGYSSTTETPESRTHHAICIEKK